jgi:spore germination protein KC
MLREFTTNGMEKKAALFYIPSMTDAKIIEEEIIKPLITRNKVIYPVEIRVLSVPSMIDYAVNKENQKKLKMALESTMKENTEKLIEKTQKEFKSEPFYWSLYVRPLFHSVKEYEEWDWTNKNYSIADINVTMDIQLAGFGK